MKGIVLAGGQGTRLHPVTISVSKHLLPIYDKPMVYYPISVLMLAGIKDILIISTSHDIDSYKKLLGDGSRFGVSFEYAIQDSPRGISDAFIVGESFIESDSVALILGDNIFYGQGFRPLLQSAALEISGARIFAYKVKDPNRFGIVELDINNNIISIEEKPMVPKSSYAITGLYFFDNDVTRRVKSLKPSARGELEVTDLINLYLKDNKLDLSILGRGFAWLDTGTFDSYLMANSYIQIIENRQGIKVACLEEIAYKQGWISIDDLKESIKKLIKTPYGKYLESLDRDTK